MTYSPVLSDLLIEMRTFARGQNLCDPGYSSRKCLNDRRMTKDVKEGSKIQAIDYDVIIAAYTSHA